MPLTITRLVMTFLGMGLGGFLGYTYHGAIKAYLAIDMSDFAMVATFLGAIIFGLIGIIISGPLYKVGLNLAQRMESYLLKIPFIELLGGTIGLILGLLIAFLISLPLSAIPLVGNYISLVVYAVFGYLGINLGRRWRDNWGKFFEFLGRNAQAKTERKEKISEPLTKVRPKVLDTSVIIDGRIVDICKAGFLEGPLVVTQFVLDELRHIADSGDHLKRVRGRRGLEMLSALQSLDEEVIISDKEYPDIEEVDIKLVQLAKDMGGAVVTNDYNLNKVASFQSIRVLNVNELAGAIKTVVLPGESLTVEIVALGKEADQGVGYLDDGTMIVVEHGKDAVGKKVETMVTSVIQTNAGRMIFVKMV